MGADHGDEHGESPNASPTAASSGSDLNGMAAQIGARAIKERMIDFAAETWNVAKEQIVFRDGLVLIGNEAISFPDLAKKCRLSRVQLSHAGYYKTPVIHWTAPRRVAGRSCISPTGLPARKL